MENGKEPASFIKTNPKKMNLTNKQQEIVFAPFRRILISAAAGTGKTLVLTERIKHLLDNLKFSPYDILALTFTRYAANEMKTRLKNDKIEIRTFHSWALNNLRMFGSESGYSKDTDVITEVERGELLQEIASECKFTIGRDFVYRDLIWQLVIEQPIGESYTNRQQKIIIRDLWQIYTQYHLTDYDKIIYDFVRLIHESNTIIKYLRNKYKHILIDEFQDTNEHIWDIFRRIDPENLFIVGDVDQCIYKFNGSRPEIMTTIANEVQSNGWKLFRLEENWRCPIDVVRSADKLIGYNLKRIERTMTGIKSDYHNKIEILN